MEFRDKTVLVTGSTQGIGRGIALKFASLGANVIVSGRNQELAESVCEEIRQDGGCAEYFLCDVSVAEDAEKLISFGKETFGGIDVIVNNAGITKDNLIARMSEEDWDVVLDVNLKGAFLVTKAAYKMLMKQKSGVIINVTSVSGVMGNPGQANYAASKAGLIGLTKSTAKEMAHWNIRCNAIAPGFIQTAMTEQLKEEVQETYLASIPLKQFGQVEDVANLAAFLASDRAKYITGQVIHVDGGLVM